ncbi:MAG: ABC transporter ATP-binding protein [Kiloniellales bacterium]|nr:ABC transporter ATP-binding protein [Kiloniellales bacterium]
MILELDKLDVSYATRNGPVHAVEGVDLAIGEDEVLGLAGESGCGKTTLIKSLLRLLPSGAKVRAEALRFKGRDLSAMSDKAFRREIMWNEISLVPQSAQASLNPVYRVGDQIVEAIREHTDTRASEAVARVEELFDLVGLEPRLIRAYPHEFSGGMRQRAMIAMALALDPALVVMDEPTTGLDVLVQERIIRKIRELRERSRNSILLITHDIAVIAEMSDRIAIMYAGQIMEVAPATTLFEEPVHPYTLGLKNAFPSIKQIGKPLISIPGSPPNLLGGVTGCPFADRCPFALDVCRRERPPLRRIGADHVAACHRSDEAASLRTQASEKETWQFSKFAA